MTSTKIPIRRANAGDAEAIGALIAEFHAYLRGLGDRTEFAFTGAKLLRDGFGPDPAFACLVAEVDGRVEGYLLYHFGYDTDYGQRMMYVVDLYVRHERRGMGIGRALMRRAAEVSQQAGAPLLAWTVYVGNAAAFRFYEGLGARHEQDLKLMSWTPSRPA